MEPSGDGELNQIFMIAKKGNIKLCEPTSSSTVCTHTLTVWQGIEKERSKMCLCSVIVCNP